MRSLELSTLRRTAWVKGVNAALTAVGPAIVAVFTLIVYGARRAGVGPPRARSRCYSRRACCAVPRACVGACTAVCISVCACVGAGCSRVGAPAAGSGGDMSPANIFSALNVFGQMRFPLMFLPVRAAFVLWGASAAT